MNARSAAPDRLHWAALAAITAVGAWVRVVYLWQPVRQDEARSFLTFVVAPFGEGLTDYSIPNNHLFHTFLAKLSVGIFGEHLWSLRLPVLIAGILLVPATYLALRKLDTTQTALLSAAFVAGSSILIEFSSNARGYMIQDLIFIVLVALGAMILRRPRPWHWPAFAVLGALGFYTVPAMIYPFGGLLLWLSAAVLWRDGRRGLRFMITRLVPAAAATGALTAALYAPVVLRSGLDPVIHNRFNSPLPFDFWLRRDRAFLKGAWRDWIRDMPLPVVYLLVAAAVAWFLFGRTRKEYRWMPAAACALVALGLPVVQRVAPFSRTWLYLLPLFLGASAAGIVYALDRLPSDRARSIVSVAVPIASVAVAGALSLAVVRSGAVLRSASTGAAPDAEEITAYLAGRLRTGDRVAAIGPQLQTLRFSFRLEGMPSYLFLPSCRAGQDGCP
ncbi:MAG: glycosyltransferase family 39 protein, partial [Candidatus Rokuibacteriota bacterium]